MNRLRSTLLLAMMLLMPCSPAEPSRTVAFPPAVGTIVRLTDPMFRQVVQRRDDNVGNILFVGSFGGLVDGFQGRSFVRQGMRGVALDWTPLVDVTIYQGYFVGVLRQPAGGFYDLQIRPVYQGQAGQPMNVYAVGVGEVFITAGQSNTTNYGTPTGFSPDPRVSSFDDGTGRGIDPDYPGASWEWGIDPQPAIDQSTGGSPWPTMASNLANALGVPIGLYASGCGGTAIAEWMPGHVKPATLATPQMILFDRLTNAIQYFSDRGGVRAVLWQQGESDYDLQTNASTYQSDLSLIIAQSRAVTGVPVKWMVNQASSPLTSNLTLRGQLEQAQANVVDYTLTFPGTNTDLMGIPYRIDNSDGLYHHFNASGLVLLGGYWGIYVANMPGFLAPGGLAPY